MKTSKTIATVSAVTLIATAGLLFAGPLNPPAGPVTSTMKTLTEVEPRIAINSTNTPGDGDSVFKITQPGSYYLTANTTVLAGMTGVEVATDNVTIDLNGFSIQPFGAASSAVRADPDKTIVLKNGFIRGPFQDSAIFAQGGGTFEDIEFANARLYSTQVTSIRRCQFTIDQSATAISLHGVSGGVIEDCQITLTHPSAEGIFSNRLGTVVRNCTVISTATPGTSKALTLYASMGGAYTGSLVTGCTIIGPFSMGIDCGNGVNINDCVIQSAVIGIRASSNCVVEHNRLLSCTTGIDLIQSNGTTVVRNLLRSCTTTMTGSVGDDVASMGSAAASTNPNANIVN